MQKPRKLLIVDRQSENREGLCALLRDGYKLVTADHGQDAMAHLEQEPDITLALINMTLPDMEGYRVLGQIRRGGAQVRTLALVEASSPGSREQALALGAEDTLEYPATAVEVQGCLRRMLQRGPTPAGDAQLCALWDSLWEMPVSVAYFQREQQESLLWANPAFFALRGAEVDLTPSVMNRVMDATLHPEDAPRIRRELREAIRSHRTRCGCWYRLQQPGGQWRTMVGTVSWAPAREGLRFTLTEADCTMLVQQEELLLGLAKRLPGAVVVFRRDAELTTLYSSVELWRILRYDTYGRATCAVAPSGMELLSTDSFARLQNVLEGQAAGGEIRLDVQLRRRDGRLMPFLMMGRVAPGAGGEAQVYAILWDVRETNRTQEELLATLHAQRETLRFLRAAFHKALPMAGIILWRHEPAYNRIWPVGVEVPGMWRIALQDAPESLIRSGLVLEDTADDCREMFRLLKLHTRSVTRILHMQLQDDRPPQWLSFHFAFIGPEEEDGTPMMMGISQDVTDKIDAIESYRRERRYREALLEDAMLCFEVDLTSRTLRRADPDFLAMLRLDNTADYMQLLQAMGEQVLLPGDREMFITRMTGERLACCFRRGTKLVQFDVQMRFSFSSQPIWVSSIAHLIEDERTGHIHMIWQLRDANEIKRQELWLRDQANRDSLTGLYNRANFEHIVTECLRQNAADGTEAAMFMLDVDNFKWINDHLGHDQGDQVLRRVGSTLRSVFRASDVVARLGGDEFAVLIPQCKNRQRIRERGAQVLEHMTQIQLPQPLTVSLGLAFTPEGGENFDKLYHSADQALYQAKSIGKGRLSVWGEPPEKA